MAQSLEQYVAQATNAYKPAADAIQQQINALPGRLDTTTQAINKDYAQQQANLNNISNQAAEAASMQAAGSGGSFGGAANLANRKYYEQSFVPAVTQLQTNRANDLANARQSNEDQRNALQTQLANLGAQANTQALSQYYSDTGAEQARNFQADQAQLDRDFNQAQAQLNREWQDYLADKQFKNEAVEAEKVRQFQAAQAQLDREYNARQAQLNRAVQYKQIESQNAYNNYFMNEMKKAEEAKKNSFTLDTSKNVYGGYNWRDGNGNLVRIADVAANTPGDFNDNLYRSLYRAATVGGTDANGNILGDYYSAQVYNQMVAGAKFEPNTTGAKTGNDMYDTLGIIRIK